MKKYYLKYANKDNVLFAIAGHKSLYDATFNTLDDVKEFLNKNSNFEPRQLVEGVEIPIYSKLKLTMTENIEVEYSFENS